MPSPMVGASDRIRISRAGYAVVWGGSGARTICSGRPPLWRCARLRATTPSATVRSLMKMPPWLRNHVGGNGVMPVMQRRLACSPTRMLRSDGHSHLDISPRLSANLNFKLLNFSAAISHVLRLDLGFDRRGAGAGHLDRVEALQ